MKYILSILFLICFFSADAQRIKIKNGKPYGYNPATILHYPLQPGILWKDEGTAQGDTSAVSVVDFTGAGVSASRSGGVLTVDISATGGEMTNPMTTTGDMIYSSSGTTPERRAIGNQGQSLQVSNGLPQWKYDTTTLITFTSGARFAVDTALFTDSTIYGSFFLDGNDTLVITGLKAVMHGGTSDTLGIQVYYNDTINVIGAQMFTNTLPINSTTIGTSPDADDWTGGAAPFKIPPGNWVWLKTPTVVAGRKPYYVSTSITGYKKRVN